MAFFDELGKKLSAAAGTAADKAKDLGEITKLKTQILGVQSDINSSLLELGRKVYEQEKRNPESAYAADCAARRKAGVTAFTATSTGFTAVCSYDRETLVLFPVPYDDGFAATVNGHPANIEKVDNGLMAVAVPGGVPEVRVEFTYRTAGLSLSVTISVAAAAVYLVYLLWLRRRRNITVL